MSAPATSSDNTTTATTAAPMYIFGYGSLLFKQNFNFNKMIYGRVKGFQRVFYQGSTDHRGIPGKPGRVVTIIPTGEVDAAAKTTGDTAAPAVVTETFVDGIVFEILPEHIEETIAYLDIREQGGYDRLELPVYDLHDSSKVIVESCTLYIANSTNEEYLGPAAIEAIAEQIISCEGPSGPNREYLFRLADALRGMGADDAHVFAIDSHARLLEEREKEA